MARILSLVTVLLSVVVPLRAEDKAPPSPKADEAKLPQFDAKLAGQFLDTVGSNWTRDRNCITCHTNLPALMARPTKPQATEGSAEIRAFLEKEVDAWSKGAKPKGDAYVVATGVGLAADDSHRGVLSPVTKLALDRMWTLQRKTGEWNWLKCDWPPMEHDDYYGATLVAVGVGLAPGEYAKTKPAVDGLAKLKVYFAKNPAPDLHHQAMLLWAAAKLPEFMTNDEKAKVIVELKKKQRADGGWNLPSLGTYMRRDQTPNDGNADSDGYGTGFVVFVLRTAGVPKSDPAVERGLAWLKANQRQSGRWFTRSLNNDKQHYISNAGTAYALMALEFPDVIK